MHRIGALPRRGGTPAGSPPIQCGMSASRSPAVWPEQADTETACKTQKAHFSFEAKRFIPGRYYPIVAIASAIKSEVRQAGA